MFKHIFPMLLATFLLLPCGSLSAHASETYVMTGPRGDWGFPAPLSHVPKGPGYALTSLIFDTLVWKDHKGDYVPALAKSWKQDQTGRLWTFTLNPKAAWHDGTPVTAGDVVFSMRFLASNRYPFAKLDVIEKGEALSEKKVRVTLKYPYAPFFAQVAGSMPVIPEHVYDSLDTKEFGTPKAAVGSGPYVFGKYDKARKQYVFEANPSYHGSAPRFDSIIFMQMSPPAASAALKRGNIDMMRVAPPPMVDMLKEAGMQMPEADSGHPVRLLFNHTAAPFSSKAARLGVAYAIDTEAVLSIAGKGAGLPGLSGGMPYSSPWAIKDAVRYDASPNKAAALFASLGWKPDSSGKLAADGKPVSLSLLVTKEFMEQARVIASQLEQTGATVTITPAAPKVFENRLAKWDFDMALTTRTAIGDPQNYANVVIGDSPYADRFRKNAELVSLLKKQAQATTIESRRTMLNKAQRIYAEELPAYQLYTPIWYGAANDRIPVWFTEGGLGPGVPLPMNKLMFLR